MLLMVTMCLLASLGTEGWASPRRCEDWLIDVRPDFQPELRLEAKSRLVRYLGEVFSLSPNEYRVLQLVLTAPREAIHYDDLIVGLWGPREPEYSSYYLSVLLRQLRNKLAFVDPTFDKIRVKRGKGIYWARADHQKIALGRVGVATFIYEGYADLRAIPLSPGEHAILTSLLKRDLVTAATAQARNNSTFSVVASHLNQKFTRALGDRLLVSGPPELRSFRLNPALR